ncbi:MAG TPA: EAL domain-containing protein [Trueperaceae bacterium]
MQQAAEELELQPYFEAVMENLQGVFDRSPDAFVVIDKASRIRGFNRSAELRAAKTFGQQMALGSLARDFVNPEDAELFEQVLAEGLAGRATRIERNIREKQGGDYWAEMHYNPLWQAGTVVGLTFMSRDITERKHYEAQVRQLAYYDSLTGLPNRRLLHERGSELLAQAENQGAPLALLYLDLDRFKSVNDTLGHDAGDELLTAVSRQLQGCLGPNDLLARLGGDEFAFLLPATNQDQATGPLERILAVLKKPYAVKGFSFPLGGSLGVACYPEHGHNLEELLRHADTAMYQGKRAGKEIAVYDPTTESNGRERLELESDLYRAVAEAQLFLHYQPLLDLTCGQLTDCEALIRWPRHGDIVPARDFIPVAEETELIRQIDKLALQGAARQAARWHQSGRELRVSLNLSARSLDYPDLVPFLEALLQEFALPPTTLQLELTEAAAMANPASSRPTLQALRELGLRLALDDFGSGYASLTTLRSLDLDQIKIDRHLTSGIGINPKDEELVRAAVSLGHGLGYQVAAEGVETASQLRWLIEQGCDLAQGHFIGMPAAADKIQLR